MKIQVNKEHYDFNKYIDIDRFSSYYYQLKEIYNIKPKNILEIGVGNGIIKKIVANDFTYKSCDFDKNLKPDIVCDVTKGIPIESNTFDIICAFQVLEHIPFNEFENILKEFKRVSKKYVYISLPVCRYEFKIQVKLPLMPKINLNLSIPLFFKKYKFDGQHYWELGTKGYSFTKIRTIINKYFNIIKEFTPYENTYHHFYLLEKKQ